MKWLKDSPHVAMAAVRIDWAMITIVIPVLVRKMLGMSGKNNHRIQNSVVASNIAAVYAFEWLIKKESLDASVGL
jgi:hypothetical protein